MNGRILLILWWLALVIMLTSGNGFWEFHILELLTFIGVVAGTLWAAYSLARTWWGKFELRFLDPDEERNPEREPKSTAIRLLPGESSAIISLRPRTGISQITRLAFSIFDNRRYPMRLCPNAVGKNRLSPDSISATKFRFENDDGTWGDWHVTKASARGTGDYISQLCSQSSRQVLEVVYKVEESKIGWDGILGIQVHYEGGGDRKQANVNSKFYVSDTARKPLTFKLRRVHSSRPCPKVTPLPASQSETGSNGP